MKVTNEMYHRRLDQFETPIQRIAQNNLIVHQVIEAYAAGAIITKEEALSQMVVLLAKDWNAEKERFVELYNRIAPPGLLRTK